MFTTLPYEYRDQSNFKQGETIILAGEMSDLDVQAIAAVLNDGDQFIPFDLHLGIAELQSRSDAFPSEDDHVWHELDLTNRTVTETPPDGKTPIPVPLFVKTFQDIAARGGWDLRRACDRLGV